MEQNKSIVDRITDAFLKRLLEQPITSTIATEFAQLLAVNEKPKADDFVAIYQPQVSISQEQETEGSTSE